MNDIFLGCAQYCESFDGRYHLAGLLGTTLSCLSPTEGRQNLIAMCDGFQALGDAFDTVPALFDFLSCKSIKEINESPMINIALTVSSLALGALSLVYLAGTAKLIDLGKGAAIMDKIKLTGGYSLADFGLIPGLRLVYIALLISDTAKQIKIIQNKKDAYNEIISKAKWQIGRNVAKIVCQSTCLATSVLGRSYPNVTVSLTIASLAMGMIAGVAQTEPVQEYMGNAA